MSKPKKKEKDHVDIYRVLTPSDILPGTPDLADLRAPFFYRVLKLSNIPDAVPKIVPSRYRFF